MFGVEEVGRGQLRGVAKGRHRPFARFRARTTPATAAAGLRPNGSFVFSERHGATHFTELSALQAHSLVMSITRRARLLRGEELGHANIFPQLPPEPEVPRNICRYNNSD
jgi:hypothetical protein